ncbi:hypothetical protein N431DRAFT_534764 [Stipitochalara longipes BDJ]|nr:hypothetical protein N431DRAFT_534764 [Stipitochalara longipes BDJ]
MTAGDMRVVQPTWKGEGGCFMFPSQRGDVVSHPRPPWCLARLATRRRKRGRRSGECAPASQRQANDRPTSFWVSTWSKQTTGRPIRARETGRPSGRALIYLSQRSDARNVRRVGSRLVSPAFWLLQPLVCFIRATFPSTPKGQHLSTSVVPILGPRIIESHTRMPCQRSSGATKLESLSQIDRALTVPEYATRAQMPPEGSSI